MDPKNKVYLSWEEVEEMIITLATQITDNGRKITAIAGIPRGGLIPATMLAHKLDLPMISTEYLDEGKYEQSYQEILVVDDICDTGKTLIPWHKAGWITAVLIQKHENVAKTTATFWAMFKDYHELHDWIVFPWEAKDAHTIPDYLAKALIAGPITGRVSTEEPTTTLAEIKKKSIWVTGHEGHLPLDDQPAFDKAMADAKEEGGPWREVVDYGDWSISENDTHYRIDEFGSNCDLYKKATKGELVIEQVSKREMTINDYLNILPTRTFNGESYGLQLMVCNSNEWSVQYYNYFINKYNEVYDVQVGKTPEIAFDKMIRKFVELKHDHKLNWD